MHLLKPVSPECVFVLSNRVVNVGPDLVGVDFHSYRSNALVMERISGSTVRGTFAGEAGVVYHLLISTDFTHWSPWSTNTVESSGLFEFVDSTVPPWRYFRAVRPQ